MTAEMSGRVPDPTYETNVVERAKDLARAARLIKEEVDDLAQHRARMNTEYEQLDTQYRAYTAEVYEEARPLSAMLDDPVTHEVTVAYWRQDESRTYDTEKLRELVGDDVVDGLFG